MDRRIKRSHTSLSMAQDLCGTLAAHGALFAVVRGDMRVHLTPGDIEDLIAQARRRSPCYTLDQWLDELLETRLPPPGGDK
jgi:hypothetical protein